MFLIKNGKVITMEGETFDNGFVLIDEKTIKKVGSMESLNENEFKNMESFDANGSFVLPGFVDAHCHLGMWEDSIGFEGDDGNEDTDPVTPQLNAIDAVNPFDRGFEEAIQGGVTTVVTGPGSANVIGGKFIALKTYGKRIDDMIIKNPVAMKVAFGENPKTVYHQKNQTPVTRMATAALIREYLSKAREYKEQLIKYEKDFEDSDKPDFDFKLSSLCDVLDKKIPLKAHCHRADDIFTAIRIAKEFDILITLDHCTEGHLIADYLKEENLPLMIGPSFCDRSKPELKNLTFKTPGILSKNGLSVAIITDHPVVPIQYINICAGLAVREGMDEYDALCAITINPAKNTGIDNRVGSIKEGKDADIIIFDKHPFDIMAKPKVVIVDGKIVYKL